jgi:hypothetical protein
MMAFDWVSEYVARMVKLVLSVKGTKTVDGVGAWLRMVSVKDTKTVDGVGPLLRMLSVKVTKMVDGVGLSLPPYDIVANRHSSTAAPALNDSYTKQTVCARRARGETMRTCPERNERETGAVRVRRKEAGLQ